LFLEAEKIGERVGATVDGFESRADGFLGFDGWSYVWFGWLGGT